MTVDSSYNSGKKYKLVPPEGGWGYAVGIAVSLSFTVTVVPLCVFGIIFGQFLSSLGDETGGTTLANGLFNTALCFAGLPANRLLQKFSYRTVGFIGCCLFSVGALATVFVTDLTQLLVTFGIFQGAGFGLIMPAIFSAFNAYFDKRQNVVMGVCQAVIVVISIAYPVITKMLMETYGFRGTLLIFAGLSLHGFVGVLLLQPVEWHLKKEEIIVHQKVEIVENQQVISNQRHEENSEGLTVEVDPLMSDTEHVETRKIQEKTMSIPSLNGFASSLLNVYQDSRSNEKLSFWEKLSKSLDLELFKSPMYINIACGLSFGITSDLAFLSIYPLLLLSFGYTTSELTTVLTVYFVADLISRIFLSFLSAAVKVWNRYVFLIGALLSAVFRIAFTINTSYWWVMTTAAALGFLRCFIQTPLPLVVAEQYGSRFPTAFSLYMVVCGFVALGVGVLSGILKKLTGSNIIVVHLLTIVYLLCAIPWMLEIIIMRFVKKTA